MKKILTMLTSISVFASSASSVISCGHKTSSTTNVPKKPSNEENEIFDHIETNAVLDQLQNGFDSEFLTAKDTVADAEGMIEDELLKEDPTIEKLNITNKKPSEYLQEGTNNFDVSITIDGKTADVKTTIKNVKSGEPNKEDTKIQAEALLEAEAKIPLHSIDNTAVSEAIAHRLTSLVEKNVQVRIEKTPKNSTTYSQNSNPAKPTNGVLDWIYNLYADFTNWTEKISIRKELIFNEIDTSKLKNASENQKEDIAFSEMEKLFNNSDFDSYKRLSTANTIADASHMIKKIADVYVENLKGLVITEDSTNTNERLKVNDNKIVLGFKYKNEPKKTINITINKITDIENDPELSAKVIKEKLEKGLSLPNLNGWDTIFDALNYFQAEATKINKNAYVKLTDTNFSNTTRNGIDEFIKNAKKIKDSKFSKEDFWKLITNPTQITHEYLKQLKEEKWIPVLNQLKKHNEFQLVNETKQINLEVGFKNPLEKESISIGSKLTLINGKISDITPINSKNLQKIISNQVLHITDKIKASDLPWYIEHHIYDKLLFPPITEKIERGLFEKGYKKEELKYLNILSPNMNPSEFLNPGKTKIKFSFKYVNFISNAHKILRSDYDISSWLINGRRMGPNGNVGGAMLYFLIALPIEYAINGLSKVFTSLTTKDSEKENTEFSLEWELNVDYENNNIKWH